jgi:hypothetical protein
MSRYTNHMAHTYLIFDYGSNEQDAQNARHTLEGWKQAFRLDKKLLVKFERSEAEKKEEAGEEPASNEKEITGKKSATEGKGAAGTPSKQSKSKKAEADESSGNIRLLVRLDFSDHEKLSYQRWLDRVPADDHFKNASPKIVRSGEPEFAGTAELFDSLD